MPKNLKAEDYRKAIRAADGIIAEAARKLGVSRRAVYDAKKKYTTVEETIVEARKTIVDEAEGKLVSIMRNEEHGDQFKAIRMVLRTQGGERWQETQRIEHAGEGGGPVRVMYDRNTPEPDE